MVIITKKETKPRAKNDFYETPVNLASFIVERYARDCQRFLDPGAGTGSFGRAIYESAPLAQVIDGVDVEYKLSEFSYSNFVLGDYLSEPLPNSYDCIIGNPPYSLAEEFIRKSLDIVEYRGRVVFLLKLAFLEGKKRAKGLFTEFPPMEVGVLAGRPSFDGSGKTNDYAFAVFVWEKLEYFKPPPTIHWLQWN